MVKSVCISSGHGKYVAGAKSYIDEVTEARKVTDKVSEYLKKLGVTVSAFHDNTSKDKNTNLKTIVNYHNSKSRELDVSVHFNAHKKTTSPVGAEVLYFDQKSKAASLSTAIASAGGFKNRGAKERKELFFLQKTSKPALLIEVCFVDSKTDVDLYKKNFDKICKAIAENIAGKKLVEAPKPTTDNKYYHVIVARYKEKDRAEDLIKQLKSEGYSPILRHHELID